MNKTSINSKAILNNSSRLKSLLNKADYLSELREKIIPLLPENLQKHCSIANYRQGVLIIYIDAATWGTQLRYLLPELLQQLRKDKQLAQLSSIEYKVRPKDTIIEKHLPKATISSRNKQTLDEIKEMLHD